MSREEHPNVTRMPPTIPVEKRIEAVDQAMEALRRKNDAMYEEHKAWEAYRAELVEEAQGGGGKPAGASEGAHEPTPADKTSAKGDKADKGEGTKGTDKARGSTK